MKPSLQLPKFQSAGKLTFYTPSETSDFLSNLEQTSTRSQKFMINSQRTLATKIEASIVKSNLRRSSQANPELTITDTHSNLHKKTMSGFDSDVSPFNADPSSIKNIFKPGQSLNPLQSVKKLS
jgi:hypothetical protein